MKPQTIDDYITFGTGFRFLLDAREGWSVFNENMVIDIITRSLEFLETFGFIVTQRTCYELIDYAERMEDKPSDYRLSAAEAKELGRIMRTIRPTLLAEAQGKVAYIVSDKRWDVNKLLDDVSTLFAPGVFIDIPDIARYDFEEAGKCIAFERPTAAAFHMMRGTESVLRQFYCSIVKRDRVDPFNWGDMTAHLKRRRSFSADTLLANLDNIRRSYRNPTQHPEKIYDIQEAQDLFGLCFDAVNRMVSHMK